MAVIDRATAQATADLIRNETVTAHNTAARVGGFLRDVVDTALFPGDAGNAVGLLSSCRGAMLSNVASLAAFPVAQDITYLAADTVLLTGQTTQSQNGPYVVGTVGGGLAALTRRSDFDTSGEIVAGCIIPVTQGSGRGQWMLTTPPPYTLGTTALVFIRSSLSLDVTAVNGPALINGDEDLYVSQGQLRVMSSVVLTSACTKTLRCLGAKHGDPIDIRVDVAQPYDLLVVNEGPFGNQGDALLWKVPAGRTLMMPYRFEWGDDHVAERVGNFCFETRGYLV